MALAVAPAANGVEVPRAASAPLPYVPPPPQAYVAPAPLPPSAILVDITGIATVGRRLHYVLIAIMLVAMYTLVSALTPTKSMPFTWPGAIVGAAIAAYLAVIAARLPVSRALADNRILVALLPLIAMAAGFELAGLSGPAQVASAAGAALLVFVGPLLYRYNKAARVLTDVTLNVRCMMTRPKILSAVRRWHGIPVLTPGAWLRVIPLAISAIIVSVLSFINLAFRYSVPFIFDWLQLVLDRLYSLALRFLGRAIRVPAGEAADSVSFHYLGPADPDMWQMTTRGDLLRWGMIGPRWLSFDEFLTLELSKFGHVIEADESNGNSPREASKDHGDEAQGSKSLRGKGRARTLNVVVIGSGLSELTATKLHPTATKLVVLAPVKRTTWALDRLRQDWMAVAPRHADLLDRLMWQPAKSEVIAVLETSGRALVYIGPTRDQWSYKAMFCDVAMRLRFSHDEVREAVAG